MDSHNRISFVVETRDDRDVLQIRPVIDDHNFIELVRQYEASERYSPSGSYGGLIPEFFRYGELDEYLLGKTEDNGYWSELGGIYILGCECGEVGCWPLVCKVDVEGDEVIWDSFSQPHRPSWRYEGFGPFRFCLPTYQDQISMAVNGLRCGLNQ